MTELKKPSSKNIYVVTRSCCRSAGVSMQSAEIVIAAFHEESLFNLDDVAVAVKAAAGTGGGDSKESKESKGDTKSAGAEAASPPGVASVVEKIAKRLPKDAKSLPADSKDKDSDKRELLPLAGVVRRLVTAAARHTTDADRSVGSPSDSSSSPSLSLTRTDSSGSGSGGSKPMLALAAFTRSMLETGHFSDVTLLVEDQKIRAHKGLLTRSAYFATMFSPQFSEGKQDTVEIKDVDAQDFRLLLEYIYTDAVPFAVVSPQHSMRLFVLADRFQLTSLADQCSQLFGETLDIDNVEECYLASLRPAYEPLKQQCLAFIASRFNDVLSATDGFMRTAKTEPVALRELMLAKTPLPPRWKLNTASRAFTDRFQIETCPAGVVISNDQLTARQSPNYGSWVVVLGQDEYKTGVHRWTVRVAATGEAHAVGVFPSRIQTYEHPDQMVLDGRGYLWKPSQGPAGYGSESKYSKQQGATVCCELDMDARRVRWCVNEQPWLPWVALTLPRAHYSFGVYLCSPNSALEIVPSACVHDDWL